MRKKTLLVVLLSAVLAFGSITYCFANGVDVNVEEGENSVKLVFTINGKKYELRLNPYTGKVVDESNNNSDEGKSAISLEEAKSIAVKDAGVENAVFKKAKLDYDDNRSVYEIEFSANGFEYEYEIDAYTGEILGSDVDDDSNHRYYNNSYYGNDESTKSTNDGITKTQAEDIALKDAGIERGSVNYINSHEDRDDGIIKYEVEFKYNKTEYDYEINAESGAIISKDIESH